MSTTAAVLDSAPATRRTESSPNTLPIVISALAVLAFAPLVFSHFQQLWLKPHYQLFPMVLAAAFFLVWPVASFSFQLGGLLKASLLALAAGGAALGVAKLAESYEFLGSAAIWAAISGLLIYAAIPMAIFAGYSTGELGYPKPAIGMKWIVAGAVILGGAVFFSSPNFAMIAALVAMVSVPLTIGGWPVFRRCLPGFLIILLIVPPPFGMDTAFVVKLQVYASELSSRILDLLEIPHNLAGVVIQAPNSPKNAAGESIGYQVAEACSGINSLLTVLACVLFYIFYFRIHWLRSIALVLAAVAWVFVINTVRIVSIVYVSERWNRNLASEPAHTILGLALFLIALFLLWSTDRFLMFLGNCDPVDRRFDPLRVTGATSKVGVAAAAQLAGAWYRTKGVAIAFGVLFAVQATRQAVAYSQPAYSGSALSRLYQAIDTDVLPENIEQFKRFGPLKDRKRPIGDVMGEFSKEWHYTRNNSTCVLSLDYPYPDYHDLRVCYRNTGWTVTGADTEGFRVSTDDGLPEMSCVRVKMSRPNVEAYASLWFCEFDQDGRSIDPTTLDDIDAGDIAERAKRRIRNAGEQWQAVFTPRSKAASGQGSILQVQLMYRSSQPLNKDASAMVEKLFIAAASKLRAKCVELKNQ